MGLFEKFNSYFSNTSEGTMRAYRIVAMFLSLVFFMLGSIFGLILGHSQNQDRDSMFFYSGASCLWCQQNPKYCNFYQTCFQLESTLPAPKDIFGNMTKQVLPNYYCGTSILAGYNQTQEDADKRAIRDGCVKVSVGISNPNGVWTWCCPRAGLTS